MTHPDANETARIADRLMAYMRSKLNDPEIEYEKPFTRLPGGFETAIYQFQLNRLREEPHKRLVLRLFPGFRPVKDASKEYIAQNVMANEGFPVARAYLLCTDKAILGGAFFLMDFLPGESMMNAPVETIPETLGKTHAALHGIDPKPLIESLEDRGFSETIYEINNRYLQLERIADDLPWTCDVVDWLAANSPSEPEHLTICHGDFHPHNILMQDTKVTGVIDWPGFCIGDPALDVANTIWLLTLAYKHRAVKIYPGFASFDWQMFAQRYLNAYQARLPVDPTKIDYFRVLRSMKALRSGFRGQELFRDPLIVKDIIRCIREVTGILLTVPA